MEHLSDYGSFAVFLFIPCSIGSLNLFGILKFSVSFGSPLTLLNTTYKLFLAVLRIPLVTCPMTKIKLCNYSLNK